MNVVLFFYLVFISCVTTFDLTILHTNDVHAHYDEINTSGGRCNNIGNCYGGMARIKHKVDEIKRLYPNTLFLDAGDQYQGTVWFTEFGGTIVHTYMNLLGYDAMALGNHEFDDGIKGLLPLVENSDDFKILSCNIDTSGEPLIQNKFLKSVIIDVNGEKIGIVGYTTKDTPILSKPGNLVFLDEVTSIQTQVTVLKNQGVKKIIALGHAGFNVDKKIALQVEDIDIVVGGHTNTFLYTGSPPSNDNPVDVYPTVVRNKNGDKVLVVQDYAFGKYLGFLQVEFDNNGKIIRYNGNPILLDNSIPKNAQVQTVTDEFGKRLGARINNVIGRTLVFLNGSRLVCRLQECNLGNLIADGMVHQNLLHADSVDGTKVFISIINSGSIRSSIEKGNITIGNVLEVSPFRETIDTIKLRGDFLLQALEHSVANYDVDGPEGAFLQYSGIKVKYNLAKPVQQRVVEALAICQNCTIPTYEPIDENVMFSLILPNFLRNGGDGYFMIRDNAVQSHIIGDLVSDVLMEYIKNASPFYNGIEGRITLDNSTKTIDKLICNDGKVIACDDVDTNTCDSLTCEPGNVITCDSVINLKQYKYSGRAKKTQGKRKRTKNSLFLRKKRRNKARMNNYHAESMRFIKRNYN
ncbi:snake venom 5'-nucleotidase-like [Mytilus trossulus]|uniref:snake venom 5'-nucleotidase-like n=1 Tax=Mytilus trossulus TaxID=6551 RepID=UPI003004E879